MTTPTLKRSAKRWFRSLHRETQKKVIGCGLFLLLVLLLVIKMALSQPAIDPFQRKHGTSSLSQLSSSSTTTVDDDTAIKIPSSNSLRSGSSSTTGTTQMESAEMIAFREKQEQLIKKHHLPPRPDADKWKLPEIEGEDDEQCLVRPLVEEQQQQEGQEQTQQQYPLPVWMPGYLGSGFWIYQHLVPKLTGMHSISVFSHRSCRIHNIPIVLCQTEWPVVQHTSPEQAYANDGVTQYQSKAVFVIRNPAHAIPSFFTRWWGNQHYIHRNHQQPPIEEWRKWRNGKISDKLKGWKEILQHWHDDAKNNHGGIGMYLPYELLIHPVQGPILVEQLTDYLQNEANVSTILEDNNNIGSTTTDQQKKNFECIWNEVIHPNYAPKEYDWEYTVPQKIEFLSVLDELIQEFENDMVLRKLLEFYRQDIDQNLKIVPT